MSDELDRAVDARIDAYRPAVPTPFAAIEARKRRRDRRRMAVGAGALSVFAVAGAVTVLPSLTGGGDRLAPGQASPGAPGSAPAERSCDAERELVLGYAPEGWNASFEAGPGGGGSDPAAIGHWAAHTPGAYVQVTRGRTWNLAAPFRDLTVLGEQAQAAQIHEGFGVDFRLCDADYQLQGYGISEDEFHRLAQSLAAAPVPELTDEVRRGCSSFTRAVHKADSNEVYDPQTGVLQVYVGSERYPLSRAVQECRENPVAMERLKMSLPPSTEYAVRHVVYTHCGVLSTTIDGALWLAEPPLPGPPSGWDENETPGDFRLTDSTHAAFMADSGVEATFTKAEPGASDPAANCD